MKNIENYLINECVSNVLKEYHNPPIKARILRCIYDLKQINQEILADIEKRKARGDFNVSRNEYSVKHFGEIITDLEQTTRSF